MKYTSEKIFDTNTLYVVSGVANERQLEECIKKAIESTEKLLKLKIDNRFRINLIVGKNKEYYGYGYIRVSTEVYYMLLGNNPDGTERTKTYPDPNWTPPSPKLNLENMNWYEMAQEEEKYIQPMLTEQLPALMTLPGYKYNDEQYKHLKKIFNGDKVPEFGYFEISKAYTRYPDSGKISNILCCRRLTDNIPIEAFNFFKFYSSDKDYPKMKIIEGNNRTLFVTFDPSTTDACFALLMTRKVHIVNSKINFKCTLIFDHAYKHRNNKKPMKRNQ